MSEIRKIYWLCSQLTQAVTEKIDILKRFQIETKVLHDFPSLVRAYSENRINKIIIRDDTSDRRMIETLQRICVRPEYAGVRFFLSLSQDGPEMVREAVALGFRDILPLDLAPELWMRRYVFASAGHVSDLADPMPQLALKNIAALYIPARITWLSDKELWLETRLVPPIGSQLNISGGLSTFFGVHHISVKVLEHHQTHLHYRYSDALLCRWDIPTHVQEKKKILRTFLNEQKTIVPYRIFNVVRGQELRKEIVRLLDPKQFQISVALSKTNMIHEPKYIGPDVILVEDVMCLGANRAAFKEMLDNLENAVPIVVVGPHAKQDKFQDISKKHKIIPLASLPMNFGVFLSEVIGEPEKLREGAAFIPKHHRLSFAQVIVSARLTHIHPDVAQLALHYPIGRFGICALESALFTQSLGRKVHIKVTSAREKQNPSLPDFPFHISGLLIDLRRQERHNLAYALLNYYRDHVLQSAFRAPKVPKEKLLDAPLAQPAAPVRPDTISIDGDDEAEEEEVEEIKPTSIAAASSVAINPSADDLYPRTTLDRAVESISSIRFIWTKELKIILVALIAFGIFIAVILMNTPPESQQGNIYTDQLRIFKERYSNPKRDRTSP